MLSQLSWLDIHDFWNIGTETVQFIKRLLAELRTAEFDVTSKESADRSVRRILDEAGCLDVLISQRRPDGPLALTDAFWFSAVR